MKGKADFRTIYISEAHPTDGWQVPANRRDRVLIATHKTLDDRRAAARTLRESLGLKLPVFVDSLDDTAAKAYAAWPDRIYIVDKEGKIAFRSGPGPAGFIPKDAEAALASLVGN